MIRSPAGSSPGSHSSTVSSRNSVPCCTSRITAAATIGLVRLAAWNLRSDVIGAPVATSATPAVSTWTPGTAPQHDDHPGATCVATTADSIRRTAAVVARPLGAAVRGRGRLARGATHSAGRP